MPALPNIIYQQLKNDILTAENDVWTPDNVGWTAEKVAKQMYELQKDEVRSLLNKW